MASSYSRRFGMDVASDPSGGANSGLDPATGHANGRKASAISGMDGSTYLQERRSMTAFAFSPTPLSKKTLHLNDSKS